MALELLDTWLGKIFEKSMRNVYCPNENAVVAILGYYCRAACPIALLFRIKVQL